MTKKNILFINGIEDNRDIILSKIYENGKIAWVNRGSANINNFLENDQFSCSRVILDTTDDQELPRQMIHGVFNQIADADSHKITLRKADDFYKVVSHQVPFFNPPSCVMETTRDKIYQVLQGIDRLQVPKTVKLQPKFPKDIYDTIEKEGFKFPVILRQAGDHGGVSTIRVDDKTEEFYAFALDGRDYYLTQFVDYTNKDGIYTKYRLVVVDGKVYIRHVIFSDHWVIHSKSREYMEKHKEYQRQEVNILKSFNAKIKPKIQEAISEIHKRLGLDYFGIDCNIDSDMNLLIFEINANMNVFTNTAKSSNNPWTKQIEMIKKAMIEMILKGKR
ncbi:MAG: ATP-grasp domain-containing protein [Sulfurovaceae bacterium]